MSNEIVQYVSDEQDLQDWMDTYGYRSITRCAGGRVVHNMYCCLHCGSSNPSEDCLAPKPKSKS